jgi:hypothetical protein
MSLEHRSIQKLFREDFAGQHPLVVDPAEREKLGAEIRARLERLEGIDTKESSYKSENEKPRWVCEFTVVDRDTPYYYRSSQRFRLLLDEQNRLTIKEDYYRGEARALVSDLEEITRFALHCKQRLARRKALRTKSEKVRQFKAQAILAQVKKLAKEEKFDFLSETDRQKLRLYVKLSQEHAVELSIPFKQFDEVLPHLRTAVVSLRHLYESGIQFKIVGRAKVSWRKEWIKHESL